MDSVTDARAVKFVNERVRPLADLIAGLFAEGPAVLAEWEAKGLATLFGLPANALSIEAAPNYAAITPLALADGSPADGRTPFLNLELLAALRMVRYLAGLGAMDGGAAANLALKIAVNPRG